MAKHHTTTKPSGDRSRRHCDAAFKQEAVNLGKRIGKQASCFTKDAQAPAEHRKNVSAPRNPRANTALHPWQSGHQLGVQSRHHPGASFPLPRNDSSIIISTCPNNLKPVSTFAGEDQLPDGLW